MNSSTRSGKHIIWIKGALLLLLLQGCASTIETPLTLTEPVNWRETVAAVSAIDSWEISGKIGVRVPERIDSAVINSWKQKEAQFTIDLSSTIFGLGATRIEGNPNYISMTESGEEPVISRHPRQLIQQHIGWPLPIEQLRYWVKGIPAPVQSPDDKVEELKFDSQGQLSQLVQNGWQVNYSKYTPSRSVSLPGKVVLRQQQVKITVIINDWQLN
ncbi:lipoprotein insertase outer membrane protein LolB [Alkalimarinus coralli]|uniref:lipoprotein insertase outer membrane protein LolB n=1 Tax=Alkalimarinus coralli TaxID=2935863 RepID=UPI00202B1656|nr:lipoprotein insertase outer membrane protein LolB [Alkalimarinus coralli]